MIFCFLTVFLSLSWCSPSLSLSSKAQSPNTLPAAINLSLCSTRSLPVVGSNNLYELAEIYSLMTKGPNNFGSILSYLPGNAD